MRPTPTLSLTAALVVLTLGTVLTPSVLPQTKGSTSDNDLTAIGHRNIGRGINFYSPGQESKLGAVLDQEVERSSRMIGDPVVADYINRLGQRIAKISDAQSPIIFRVIDSNVVDTMTLPGGFQFVNSGLILTVESEAELAGVLAHGIAHTAMRDSTKTATRAKLMQLASIPAIIFIPYSSFYSCYEGWNLTIPLTFLKHRRDAEFDADFFGMQYLYVSGYDPESYLRLVQRLAKPAAKSKSLPKIFSPFPPFAERLKAMQEEMDRLLPLRQPATVSSSEFEVVKERLQAWQVRPSADLNSNFGKDTRPQLRKRVQ